MFQSLSAILSPNQEHRPDVVPSRPLRQRARTEPGAAPQAGSLDSSRSGNMARPRAGSGPAASGSDQKKAPVSARSGAQGQPMTLRSFGALLKRPPEHSRADLSASGSSRAATARQEKAENPCVTAQRMRGGISRDGRDGLDLWHGVEEADIRGEDVGSQQSQQASATEAQLETCDRAPVASRALPSSGRPELQLAVECLAAGHESSEQAASVDSTDCDAAVATPRNEPKVFRMSTPSGSSSDAAAPPVAILQTVASLAKADRALSSSASIRDLPAGLQLKPSGKLQFMDLPVRQVAASPYQREQAPLGAPRVR
eukprot:TRINITY_DN104376_c0_g1_i1.p1 TRINITY_DN104376_c0_g1~~TRINITY_DN104376_c0_g1_i1.p1  ORF type:complete len:314 (-),score=31.26 TRINITY_DN104376_c0_g1_i1:131-1072(-)